MEGPPAAVFALFEVVQELRGREEGSGGREGRVGGLRERLCKGGSRGEGESEGDPKGEIDTQT